MLICFVYRWIWTLDPACGVCEESDIDPAWVFLLDGACTLGRHEVGFQSYRGFTNGKIVLYWKTKLSTPPSPPFTLPPPSSLLPGHRPPSSFSHTPPSPSSPSPSPSPSPSKSTTLPRHTSNRAPSHRPNPRNPIT